MDEQTTINKAACGQSDSTDGLGVGHDGKPWPQTMDAKIWADEFCKRNSASDHGTMLGWFANAIMIGYDTARWEFEGSQETTTYLTPSERDEKQAVLNSAMRSILDNMATPNA